MTTRGIRNNNPGNIDRNATKWQGMAADQSGDPRFVVFTDAKWGIRAIARLLLTYANQYGLHTVAGLIGRWAPPGENNTSAYVAAVCAAMKSAGFSDDPNAEIDVDSAAVMRVLVCGIIQHENGVQPYADSVIAEGIRVAGVSDAPPKPLLSQGTFVTKAVGTGGLAIGACVDACKALIADPSKVQGLSDQAKAAASQLDAFSGVAIFDHVKTALLTVGGGLLVTSLVLSAMKQRAS